MAKSGYDKESVTNIKIPMKYFIENIDILVEKGIFRSRPEAIKTGLRLLFDKYNNDLKD